MVQLTNKLKYEIIVKSEMGMSSNKIAESMNINVKTVLKWINISKSSIRNRLMDPEIAKIINVKSNECW